jgi:hypothetical protein
MLCSLVVCGLIPECTAFFKVDKWATQRDKRTMQILWAISCQISTAAARIRYRVMPCMISDGQCDTKVGSFWVRHFPLPVLIPPTSPRPLIILSKTLYSVNTDSSGRKEPICSCATSVKFYQVTRLHSQEGSTWCSSQSPPREPQIHNFLYSPVRPVCLASSAEESQLIWKHRKAGS